MNGVEYRLTYPTYNLDKGVCVESEHDVSIFHRDRSKTARHSAAPTRQSNICMAKLGCFPM